MDSRVVRQQINIKDHSQPRGARKRIKIVTHVGREGATLDSKVTEEVTLQLRPES